MTKRIRLGLALLAVLVLCVGAGCPPWLGGSADDPTSPPDAPIEHWTAADVLCGDGTPARNVHFIIDNRTSSQEFFTIPDGANAGWAAPIMMKYEPTFFSTDPPWRVTVKTIESTTCGGPVSPPTTCVESRTYSEVVLDWRSKNGYKDYLQAEPIIECN